MANVQHSNGQMTDQLIDAAQRLAADLGLSSCAYYEAGWRLLFELEPETTTIRHLHQHLSLFSR